MNRALAIIPLPTSTENTKVEATTMKRKERKGKSPTLVNIGILCLPKGKQYSSKKIKMEKGSFGSIGRLKNTSSIQRYSQMNGFAMSLQQKVRVKLPKLLVVKHPMQKTEKGAKGKKKKIKWTKPAGLLPKEIGSIFCNASRNKKTLQRDSSSSKNDRHGDADALEECMEERDLLIVSGKKGNMFKSLLEDSVERLTLSKSCSFKNILRIIDTKAKPLELNDEENSEISSNGARKQPWSLTRNLSGLFEFRFRKKIGFCFTNWKTNKADPGTDFEGADYGAVTSAETGEMSKTINWASIKRQPAGYCIIRRVKSIRKRVLKQGKEHKHEDEEQEEVELELCKKRILMGGKCRPLSASGCLHYDQNGILLPELPYQEL